MALNDTLKTRILLRNDTLANWEGSSLVLGKGEVAIATLAGGELAEVRVGTGSSTWATSLKLNVNIDQVSGLVDLIEGTAKKYQVVANGEGGNSWKLQEAALSGGDWSDVTGSTWSVDFTAINNAINGLTADVDYLSGAIDDLDDLVGDTRTTLNTVSSDYLKSSDKTELSDALTALDAAKLAKSEFADLSNEIGLSAATAENPVVTKNDIADLAGAMHFKGAVASLAEITSAEPGDVVIIPSTSKEYVYNGSAEAEYSVDNWVELGDEDLYATKAEVATISGQLTSDIAGLNGDVDYLSGQITAITSDYATKAELNDVSVALSTDYQGKIDGLVGDVDYLSGEITSIADTYATKDYVDGISAALSGDYQGKIDGLAATLSTVSSDYLTSSDKTELVETIATVSGETLVSANAYTDEAVAALSIDDYIKHGECVQSDLSGFFVLDCGGSALRPDEPTA